MPNFAQLDIADELHHLHSKEIPKIRQVDPSEGVPVIFLHRQIVAKDG